MVGIPAKNVGIADSKNLNLTELLLIVIKNQINEKLFKIILFQE